MDAALAPLATNICAMFSILGVGTAGSILDTPERLVVEAPLPQPPYNAVLRFRDDGAGPLTEQVAKERARFTRRDVNGVFLRHPTAPDGLDAALMANGLEEAEQLAGMALDLTTDLPARRAVDGVQLLEASENDAADWVDLVTWRYGLESTTEDYLREIYVMDIGTHSRLFVARIDGCAVSKVVLHLSDGFAGIYGVPGGGQSPSQARVRADDRGPPPGAGARNDGRRDRCCTPRRWRTTCTPPSGTATSRRSVCGPSRPACTCDGAWTDWPRSVRLR